MSFPDLKAKKDLINVYQLKSESKGRLPLSLIFETAAFTNWHTFYISIFHNQH
jgi:hypothetical protein